MQSISQKEWQSLPEQAQQKIYDFYLKVKKNYESSYALDNADESEILAFSNHTANHIEEWNSDIEDDVWK